MKEEVFERRIMRIWAKRNNIPLDMVPWLKGTMKYGAVMLHVAFERLIKATIKTIFAPLSKKSHVSTKEAK